MTLPYRISYPTSLEHHHDKCLYCVGTRVGIVAGLPILRTSLEMPYDQISVKVAIISNELRRLATSSFED